MAFCGKLGGILRQSVSRNVQSPMASMVNSIRCMSSSKLFVGGIIKCYLDAVVDVVLLLALSLKFSLFLIVDV